MKQSLVENKEQSSCVYGVEQSCHGHNYRWIFDKQTLLNQGIDLPNTKGGICEDILFPIGGSNSSATWIVELDSDNAIKDFLLSDYYTEFEDPMLIDIAEGSNTISCEDGSITGYYIKKLAIPEEKLTRDNGYLAEVQDMICFLKEKDANCDLDYENPFYGNSRDMRLSALRDLYNEYTKSELDKQEERDEY